MALYEFQVWSLSLIHLLIVSSCSPHQENHFFHHLLLLSSHLTVDSPKKVELHKYCMCLCYTEREESYRRVLTEIRKATIFKKYSLTLKESKNIRVFWKEHINYKDTVHNMRSTFNDSKNISFFKKKYKKYKKYKDLVAWFARHLMKVKMKPNRVEEG